MNTAQITEVRKALGLEDVALSDDDLQKFYEMNQSELKAHGADPATREQAAAYGAGHLIIAASLGLKGVLRVTLTQRGDNLGWVAEKKLQLVPLQECHSETADPTAVLKSALQCLAGFAGEMFKGVGHPNSALQMRIKFAIYASYLDHVYQAPPGTYFNRTIDLVRGILAFNEVAFNEIYPLLLSNGAIDCEQGNTPLAKVQPAVLSQIFGSLQ